MSEPEKYNLYIVSRKDSSGHETWMLATIPMNGCRGNFYYADLTNVERYPRDSKPPTILRNQLLDDENLIYKELLSTITFPHMRGYAGFDRIVGEITGVDNITYILRALFDLEHWWLVPDETWAEWNHKLNIRGWPPKSEASIATITTRGDGSSSGGSSTARGPSQRSRGNLRAAGDRRRN